MSGEAIAGVGAAVGLLAVLLPVILTQGASLHREIDAIRADVGDNTARTRTVSRDSSGRRGPKAGRATPATVD